MIKASKVIVTLCTKDHRMTKLMISLLVFILTACATSPTGRKQLIILGDSQMNAQGTQAFSQMKQETPIETDAKINTYVKCIVTPLTKVVDANGKGRSWEVVVFKSDQVNAFALPGGKIGVYTGIMKAAKNADQLAAVVGHEIGHVLARHGAERVSETFLTQGLLTAGGALMGTESQRNQVLLAALGAGAQFGFLLPHSRNQESESDLIGLDLMARAGFNPAESVTLWQNMKAASGGSAPPEFMSTHPSNDRRIKDLQANIPKVMPSYQAAPNKPVCRL